jgi:hypothetical protein
MLNSMNAIAVLRISWQQTTKTQQPVRIEHLQQQTTLLEILLEFYTPNFVSMQCAQTQKTDNLLLKPWIPQQLFTAMSVSLTGP